MRVELSELLSFRGLVVRAQSLRLKNGRGSTLAGSHAGPFLGRGMSFAESRPYLPGDDWRTVDWRATARTGRPFTKCYEAEHERPTWLVIDQGESMHFGSQGTFKSIQAARAAAWFGWLGAQTQDRVGSVIVRDTGGLMLPAERARRGVLRLLHALVEAPTECADRDAAQTVQAGLLSLNPRLRGGDRVVVVSDFHALSAASTDLRSPFLDVLAQIGRQTELILVHVFDALEKTPPPPGHYPVTVGDQMVWLDLTREAARQAWHLQFFERHATLRDFCARHRARLFDLPTEASVAEVLGRA